MFVSSDCCGWLIKALWVPNIVAYFSIAAERRCPIGFSISCLLEGKCLHVRLQAGKDKAVNTGWDVP
jgi:hypothetical protein